MIKININNKEMILTIMGLHKLWALKSKIVIPLNQIASARLNNNEVIMPNGWKIPGTYIPGLITAGTFRSHGNKIFWDVVHLDKSIIIDLQENEYEQLVLEVENPEESIKAINARIANTF